MENRDKHLAENFAYLRDVLGVRFLTLPTKDAPPESLLTDTLEFIESDIAGCVRCKLSRARKNIVFGSGYQEAEIMMIGESPGEEEDSTGQPFVGSSGELLSKMISAMGFSRSQVYLTNLVKCRPPLDREIEESEWLTCSSFLERQINAVKPRMIILLGESAARSVLRTDKAFRELRGKILNENGQKYLVTFAPSHLLSHPLDKKSAWSDLQILMKELATLK
jgi:uracil-DNA glycosylase family 4